MALAWMPDEERLNRVLDGIDHEVFSDESEAELSVHEESESKEKGTAEIQDFSDSGDSYVHSDDNGMFFVCLHYLATGCDPIFSRSKFFIPSKKYVYNCVSVTLVCGAEAVCFAGL